MRSGTRLVTGLTHQPYAARLEALPLDDGRWPHRPQAAPPGATRSRGRGAHCGTAHPSSTHSHMRGASATACAAGGLGSHRPVRHTCRRWFSMTSVLARDSASPQRRDCADTCDPPPPTLTLGQTLHECTRLSPDVRARAATPDRRRDGGRESESRYSFRIQNPPCTPSGRVTQPSV